MAPNVDGGYAWVVLVACFTVDMINGILITSVGILTPAIVDEIDNDITKVSSVSSTLLATSTLLGPLAGIIQDRIGSRLTGIISGSLILIGLTAAAFCKTITGLVLTFGILTGLGSGLAVNLSGVAPGNYFVKKLPVAYGVIQAGGGFGLFLVGPLMVFLLNLYNLQGTLLILGGIGFHICLASALIRPQTIEGAAELEVKPTEEDASADAEAGQQIRLNSTVGREDRSVPKSTGDGFAESEDGVTCDVDNASSTPGVERDLKDNENDTSGILPTGRDSNDEIKTVEPLLLQRQSTDDLSHTSDKPQNPLMKVVRYTLSVLGSNGFIFYLLSGFFWSIAEASCLVHLPNYAESKGSTPTQSATLLTGMGITSVVSGVLSGFAATDPVIGNILLNFGYLGLSGTLTVLFPLYSYSYPLQMVYSLLYGIYSQAPYTLAGPICIELAGLSNLAVAYGLSAFFLGMGYLVGPPLAGLIYKQSGVYDYSFIFTGCCILIGTFFVGLVPIFKNKKMKGDANIEIVS